MRTATIGVFLVAVGVLAGCASSQQSIDEYSNNFRSLELQARGAMLVGNHALADTLYIQASQQLNQSDEVYVDGYFYLDRARMEGNRAFMALLDGNEGQAREHFSLSERYLTSGVQVHKAVLNERVETQQDVTALLGIGALIGVTAMGMDAADENPARADEIYQSLSDTLELTADMFDGISRLIEQIHEVDIDEDAQQVDLDQWRAAVVSDHPISRAIVRVSQSREAPSCTAFFIQPRIVATSAHCLDEMDQGRLWVRTNDPREKEIFLESMGGRSLDWETVYWPDSYDWPNTCHRDDVALIVTENASEYWLPIDTQPVVGTAPAMVIGYSGDLDSGFFQRMDYGCLIGVSTGWPGMVSHNCATYPGNSGGPVFSVDSTRSESPFRVVGINSCGYTELAGDRIDQEYFGDSGWNNAAGIQPLERLYNSVIADNPTAGDDRLFE